MRSLFRLYLTFLAYTLASYTVGAQAGSDYIITTTHDTLYGRVQEYGILGRHDLSVKSASGKKLYFDFDKVLEWKNGANICMIMPVTTKKGKTAYEEMLVLVYGKAKLMRMISFSGDVLYVFINDAFYFVSRNNLVEFIWPAMLQCEKFAQTYGGIPVEEAGGWHNDLSPRRLSEAVYYYNRHCD